eukprot:13380557-Alexandrium_andersonii.AAC.1
MSASLVGSEMCIRDSHPLRSTARQEGGLVRCGEVVAALRVPGDLHTPHPCLLYTSDAADDM